MASRIVATSLEFYRQIAGSTQGKRSLAFENKKQYSEPAKRWGGEGVGKGSDHHLLSSETLHFNVKLEE